MEATCSRLNVSDQTGIIYFDHMWRAQLLTHANTEWLSVPMAAGWLFEYTPQQTDHCLSTRLCIHAALWKAFCIISYENDNNGILYWKLTSDIYGNINLWEPTLGTFLKTCVMLTSRNLNNKYISTRFQMCIRKFFFSEIKTAIKWFKGFTVKARCQHVHLLKNVTAWLQQQWLVIFPEC